MKVSRYTLIVISGIWIVSHWFIAMLSYEYALTWNISDVHVAVKVSEFLGDNLYENFNVLWGLAVNEISREEIRYIAEKTGVPQMFWTEYGMRQLIILLSTLYGVFKNWHVVAFLFSALNFVVFYLGWVRVISRLFSVGEVYVLVSSLFLPSFFFWSSVLHPEALFLSSIGGVLWWWIGRWKKALAFLLIALLWRLEISLLVGTMVLLLKRPLNINVLGSLGVLVLLILIFFPDGIWFVCDRQEKFFTLLGETSFGTFPICYSWYWTALAVLRALPEVVLSPIVIGGPAGFLFLFENIGSLMLSAGFLVREYKHWRMLDLILIAITVMFIIGLTVNNAGTIIRYRTISITLLLMPTISVLFQSLVGKMVSEKY